MMDLLRAEEQCVYNVRQSEREVSDIIEDRTQEELTTELTVSIYDTYRNEKAKKHREMLVCFKCILFHFIHHVIMSGFVRILLYIFYFSIYIYILYLLYRVYE